MNLKILGSINSKGSNGAAKYDSSQGYAGAGSSGGGSINIFYNVLLDSNWTSVVATGGQANGGTKAGNGTITAGSIATGTFVKE